MTALYINGFGTYLPTRKISNKELEPIVGTDDAWVVARTGIQNRYALAPDEQLSDAGALAAKVAMQAACVDSSQISTVIVATCTTEYLCPSTACLVSYKLGIEGPMAFDLTAACSGFVYGLKTAKAFVDNSTDHVLLVCAEALTRRINWKDKGTAVLFGDGAGAVVLSSQKPEHGAEVLDVICYSNGKHGSLLQVGGGTSLAAKPGDTIGEDFFISMEGREVFKHAVRNLTAVSKELLAKHNLSIDDVDLFIPHQANLRIIEAVGERLSIPKTKVFVNVHNYGNTSSASIPIAIADALEQGVVQPGMTVLLATFGAGFTWAAALLKFH